MDQSWCEGPCATAERQTKGTQICRDPAHIRSKSGITALSVRMSYVSKAACEQRFESSRERTARYTIRAIRALTRTEVLLQNGVR